MPPVPVSEPVKPVLGVTVHALLTIVPLPSVEAHTTTTEEPVKAVAGAVIAATGAVFTIIDLLVVLVAP